MWIASDEIPPHSCFKHMPEKAIHYSERACSVPAISSFSTAFCGFPSDQTAVIASVDDVEKLPQIVVPAARQASFGRIIGRVPPGTKKAFLLVDGKRVLAKRPRQRKVRFRYQLPRRDVTLRLIAVDGRGTRTRSQPVGPVLGLPARAAPRPSGSREHASLARALRKEMRGFPGVTAVYVRDLVTGDGASWNATAQFPAGSTLKVALALEALRVSPGPPAQGSELGRLLESMLVYSSNVDANRLAITIAGSTRVAWSRVRRLMARLGMNRSEAFGGYQDMALATPERSNSESDSRGLATSIGTGRVLPPIWRAIPLETIEEPRFGPSKRTTAADLSRLFTAIHLAAGGRGPLIKHYRHEITPTEVRHLLYLLTHTQDREKKLAAQVPYATVAHKGGWIPTARHDAGIVYWKAGAFVASVMTFSAAGVGAPADRLAAQVARTSLKTLRR